MFAQSLAARTKHVPGIKLLCDHAQRAGLSAQLNTQLYDNHVICTINMLTLAAQKDLSLT